MAGPIGSHLSDFRAKVKNIARANRFTVEVFFSDNIKTAMKQYDLIKEGSASSLKYLATKSSIPAFDVEGPILKFRGTQLVLPGDYKREPLVVTFINDDQWKARSLFEDWMRSSVSHDVANERNKLEDIRTGTKIIVKQYKSNDATSIADYHYFDCMPLKVSNIDLDHSEQNSIETFTVEFHYSTWDRQGESVSPAITKDGVLVVNVGNDKVSIEISKEKLELAPIDNTKTTEEFAGKRVAYENFSGWPIDLKTGGIDASRTSAAGLKQLLLGR